jgi:hypothetical protein
MTLRPSPHGKLLPAAVLHMESRVQLGYTDLPNFCEGIKRHSLIKRMAYVTDAIYDTADALRMIIDGYLIITRIKMKQPLRISIAGKLPAAVLPEMKCHYSHPLLRSAPWLQTM